VYEVVRLDERVHEASGVIYDKVLKENPVKPSDIYESWAVPLESGSERRHAPIVVPVTPSTASTSSAAQAPVSAVLAVSLPAQPSAVKSTSTQSTQSTAPVTRSNYGSVPRPPAAGLQYMALRANEMNYIALPREDDGSLSTSLMYVELPHEQQQQ